jgi:hypothetical protein
LGEIISRIFLSLQGHSDRDTHQIDTDWTLAHNCIFSGLGLVRLGYAECVDRDFAPIDKDSFAAVQVCVGMAVGRHAAHASRFSNHVSYSVILPRSLIPRGEAFLL